MKSVSFAETIVIPIPTALDMTQFNLLLLIFSLFISQNPVSAVAINSTKGFNSAPHGSNIYYDDSSNSGVLERRNDVPKINAAYHTLRITDGCNLLEENIIPGETSVTFVLPDYNFRSRLGGKDERNRCAFSIFIVFPPGKKYTILSQELYDVRVLLPKYTSATLKLDGVMDTRELPRVKVDNDNSKDALKEKVLRNEVAVPEAYTYGCEDGVVNHRYEANMVQLLERTRELALPFGEFCSIGFDRNIKIRLNFAAVDC